MASKWDLNQLLNQLKIGTLKQNVLYNCKFKNKTPQKATIYPYKVKHPVFNLKMFSVWLS